MPSCSKAPRGLFVLLRVGRVFTANSTSPGLWLRQRPTRYAFRAGRNLPDKEFRYLRTVIVTAAVHRGFGSKLAPLPLTFRHWAGVSPYTSVFTFAETCVFGKQSVGPLLCHPFSRVTLLPKLRVHVAEFLNQSSPVRLGLLDLPTSVGMRYGHTSFFANTAFLGSHAQPLPPEGSLAHPLNHSWAGLRHCVPSWLPWCGTGLLTRCPSASPCGCALGPTNPTRTNLASET